MAAKAVMAVQSRLDNLDHGDEIRSRTGAMFSLSPLSSRLLFFGDVVGASCPKTRFNELDAPSATPLRFRCSCSRL
jgi:hypothetical protein